MFKEEYHLLSRASFYAVEKRKESALVRNQTLIPAHSLVTILTELSWIPQEGILLFIIFFEETTLPSAHVMVWNTCIIW
jgi:hypothetical protein